MFRRFTAVMISTCVQSTCALVLLLSGVAVAQDAPFLIAHSRSPDGRIEIWIKPEKGAAAGTAQIRAVKTQKISGTFDWSGFGVEVLSTNADPAFTVLWRHDSRYFAIKYEEARGWMTGAVYGRSRNGRWLEVQMPRDGYMNAIKKVSGVSELFGKGCDSPVEWLSNGDLNLEFADRNVIFDHEDLFKEYTVTLKVADEKGQPLKLAKIVSIKQKSKEEVEKELNSK